MPFRTRLTLAASILAMAASGPLGAQTPPLDGDTAPVVDDSLASEPAPTTNGDFQAIFGDPNAPAAEDQPPPAPLDDTPAPSTDPWADTDPTQSMPDTQDMDALQTPPDDAPMPSSDGSAASIFGGQESPEPDTPLSEQSPDATDPWLGEAAPTDAPLFAPEDTPSVAPTMPPLELNDPDTAPVDPLLDPAADPFATPTPDPLLDTPAEPLPPATTDSTDPSLDDGALPDNGGTPQTGDTPPTPEPLPFPPLEDGGVSTPPQEADTPLPEAPASDTDPQGYPLEDDGTTAPLPTDPMTTPEGAPADDTTAPLDPEAQTPPTDPALDGAGTPPTEPTLTEPEAGGETPDADPSLPEGEGIPGDTPEATPDDTTPPEGEQQPDTTDPETAPVFPDAPEVLPDTVAQEIESDPVVQESVQVLEQGLNTPPLAAAGAEPAGAPTTRTITTTRTAGEEFDGAIVGAASLLERANTPEGRSDRQRERDARRDRLESAGLGVIAGLVVGAIIADRQEVVATAPERVVVVDRSTNIYQIWRDDDAILRRPGTREETTVYPDGSVRTVLTSADGTRVITVRNATGRVLQRERLWGDQRVVIVDDLRPVRNVDTRQLPPPRIPRVTIPRNVDPVLGAQLVRESTTRVDRAFSLGQIRNIWEVRRLVPVLDTDPVLFATGSAALSADQARALSGVAAVMGEMLRANPREVFLVEGHTDAVGSAASNLTLSDRRAETIAQALVEYFRIPPENLVFQGYGESLLAVPTSAAEPRNRRVEIRRITPLLDPRTR